MKFIQKYAAHDPRLYSQLSSTPLSNPILAHKNEPILDKLGLDKHLDWQAIIGGDIDQLNNPYPPLAMAYAGHQFGQWAGRLGDGRGLLIGEIDDSDFARTMELHLKGAGKTPYSRRGDGRAMIASTVREYLCGHALNHLGVASSDAIGFVVSDTPIQRHHIERAASLLRVSDCHVRLGHIEYVAIFAPDYLADFIDKLILDYYPSLHKSTTGKATDIAAFIQAVCQNTAAMIAKWQLVGFSHGVMNTDNLNITGTTLDFGPFGFMERFDPAWINNHSDHQGRYTYQNQPSIARWNLAVVLQHLERFVGAATIQDALAEYERVFLADYQAGIAAKLGLTAADQTTRRLASEFLQLLERCKADYTNSFRMLIALVDDGEHRDQYRHEYALLAEFEANIGAYRSDWTAWKIAYQNAWQANDKAAIIQTLTAHNPVYVLRNHMAQKAIDAALQDDFGEVARLFALLADPFRVQSIATIDDTLVAVSEPLSISCMS